MISGPAALRAGPCDEAEALCDLAPGESFAMLDNSLGWAWGYAGEDRRVGYVRSEAIGPQDEAGGGAPIERADPLPRR